MPLYEYVCGGCGQAFERYVRAWGEAVVCPACARRAVEKKISRLRVRRGLRRRRRLVAAGGRLRLRPRRLRLRPLMARARQDVLRAKVRRAEEGGGAERRQRQHARGQAHRARARGAAARRGLVRGAGQARRAPLPGLRDGGPEGPRRRRRLRLRADRRPPGLRLRPGLHGLRRQPLRDQRPEDLQGDGPGHEDGRARHRPERLRRRAHPGGCGLAGRLRGHLPAQHPGLRRRAPDLRHPGPLRGGRRLQPRHHRLQRDGEGHLVHVRDRARRHQDRHPRGGHQGGAGRGHDPQRQVRAWPTSRWTTTGPAWPSSASCSPTCPPTTWRRPPLHRDRGPAGPRGRRRSTRSSPPRPTSPTTSSSSSRRWWTTRRFLEVHAHYAPNIVVGFARFGGRSVGHRGQPARGPGGLPGHRRLA